VSDRRQVRLHFSLAGRAHSPFLSDDFGNADILESVTDQIKYHFGVSRPFYIFDREIVTLKNRLYPDFYVAGWFVSDLPLTHTTGPGSELVVVAHGDSMAAARASMMVAIENSNWESLAKNI